MKMRCIFLGLVMVMVCMSCVENKEGPVKKKEKKVETITTDSRISDIIRNPVTASGKMDTVNVAKMVFEDRRYDFGRVTEGDVVVHVFKFRNTGKVPLVIADARSTCGCTVPKWPEAPVEPGEAGEILVRFDTKGKQNKQYKPVTITANTYPMETEVMVRGNVIPKPK